MSTRWRKSIYRLRAHAETYPARRAEYGIALSDVIELGRSLNGMEHHRLMLQVMDFRCRLHALFEEADLLALPVLPFPVPTVERAARMTDEVIHSIIRFTSPFSMSGHPTINMPCGFADNKGPISLQFVGPYFGEVALIKAASAFQRETGWHKRRPLP
jgi:amidase